MSILATSAGMESPLRMLFLSGFIIFWTISPLYTGWNIVMALLTLWRPSTVPAWVLWMFLVTSMALGIIHFRFWNADDDSLRHIARFSLVTGVIGVGLMSMALWRKCHRRAEQVDAANGPQAGRR